MSQRPPQYYIRKPQAKKTKGSFAILRRIRDKTGKSKGYETLDSEVVDAVNRQYQSDMLPWDQSTEALKREIKRLRGLEAGGKKVTLSSANQRLLDKYWNECYAHRTLVDEKSAKNRLRRAIEALGDTPLTAERNELQRAVNTNCKGNKQRPVVAALNSILKWSGRADCKLLLNRKDDVPVKYLTLEQFRQIIPLIPATLQGPAIAAFATGCRVGEVMCLSPESLRLEGAVVHVAQQLRKDLTLGPTKNRKKRDAPVLPEFKRDLIKWLSVPKETKQKIRKERHAEGITEACKQVWPGDQDKWLTFHDLRHSYAIHLLNKGTPLSLVAQAIGDSPQVTAESYTGFVLTADGLGSVINLLNATSKKPNRKKSA